MSKGEDNYVYIAEADPEAVRRAVRRLQILLLTFIPILLIGAGMVFVLRSLLDDSPPLSSSLPALLILLAIPPAAAYLVVPRCMKKIDVMIGADFILAPLIAPPKSTVTVRYGDILRVRLDVSKGRIAGATIGAKSLAVHTGRIKDPAVVVRAIFEQTSDKVKWRRSGWPSGKLSRDEVRTLIEKSQAPALKELLPPSVTLARADDLFPQRKGLFGRRSGRQEPRSWIGLSSEHPTPASRYVDFLLLKMLHDGETARTLRRSEALRTLTHESGTADPPPLEDVLDRLKSMCRSRLGHGPNPREGTIDVKINSTRCKVACRFDDNSDACCQIRLERVAE